MRKISLIIATIAFLICSSVAFAAEIGSPIPMKKSEVSVGAGYSFESGKYNMAGMYFRPNINQGYASLGVGLPYMLEVNVKFGGENLQVPDHGFSGGTSFFGALEVKKLVYDGGDIKVGAFADGSRTSGFSQQKSSYLVKIDEVWGVEGGIAAQTTVLGVKVWAGPIAFYRTMNVEVSGSGVVQSKDKALERGAGGVAGVSIPIVKNLSLGLEGKLTKEGNFSGGLAYKF